MPVWLWILLGVAVAAVSAAALVLVLVRFNRNRAVATPYRVPATVLRVGPPEGDSFELDLAVAWPGESMVTVTIVERTTDRRFPAPLTARMAVSVFSPPDRAWYRLDWSQFDDLTIRQKGSHLIVPESTRETTAAESSNWQVTCKTCGFTRSVWAIGGVRFGARGETYQGMACPICQRLRLHHVWRPRTAEPPSVPIVAN